MATGTPRPPRCARPRPFALTAATDDQHALAVGQGVEVGTGLLGARSDGDPSTVDHEASLDPGGRLTRADRARVGPAAEQQAEPGDHHRLARARLAGDDGQAGAELEDRLADHAEAGDAHLLDHGAPRSGRCGLLTRSAGPRQPVTGRRNFATSRSVNGPVVEPGEPDRLVGPPDLDPCSEGQLEGPAAVAPQHAAGRGPLRLEHLDGQHGRRRHDQRPGEQRVRRDRHHQQGLDLRPDHRPAGGERVGGRPGRRGHHDAVAADGRHRAAVDLGDDLEHPLPARLLDAGLVDRPRARQLLALATLTRTSSVIRSSTS